MPRVCVAHALVVCAEQRMRLVNPLRLRGQARVRFRRTLVRLIEPGLRLRGCVQSVRRDGRNVSS